MNTNNKINNHKKAKRHQGKNTLQQAATTPIPTTTPTPTPSIPTPIPTTTTAATIPIAASMSSSHDSQDGSSGNGSNLSLQTSATSSLSPITSLKPHLHSKPQPLPRSQSTSFPLVANEKTSHLFPLLPNPGSNFVIPTPQATTTTTTTPTAAATTATTAADVTKNEQQGETQPSKPKVSVSSTDSDQTTLSRHGLISTEETSVSTNSRTNINNNNINNNEEDDDFSRPRTLRYNWTDYEDRLLLKIILSNHATIHDFRYKPLKRFWELVAELIKNYSINTKVSRTHRQCRERFYVLYNKLVKFAEQLGIDPTALHRRLSQGLSFTELEELYLKILQVLRLEDGFKLVVNSEFYNDPKAVEELDKSVSLINATTNLKDDESTVSMPSSKISDEEKDGGVKMKDVVINNTTSQHHKITPFTSLKRSASRISKFSFSTGSFSPSSDNNNSDRSQLNHEQDRANLDDIMSSPPITRLDNRSYSSLSSGVSSTRVDDVKPNVFLKDKKRRNTSISSGNSHRYNTNVDDSSNSSLGSASNSQAESNGELELSSNSNGNTPLGSRAIDEYMVNEQIKLDKSVINDDKYTSALEILSTRMDKIDTNIEDLYDTINKMDDKVKFELTEAFDRISKFQDGINENISLIISELRQNNKSKEVQELKEIKEVNEVKDEDKTELNI